MKGVTEVIANHDVMGCPACGLTITARVVIDVTLGAPTLSEGGGKVDVPVTSGLRTFSVNHACPGPAQDIAPPPSDAADVREAT